MPVGSLPMIDTGKQSQLFLQQYWVSATLLAGLAVHLPQPERWKGLGFISRCWAHWNGNVTLVLVAPNGPSVCGVK